MKTFSDQSGGVKINRRFTGSEGCPSWAKRFEVETWDKHGVIVWDETTQRIEHLFASQALRLLDKLRTADDWTRHGIPITKTVIHIPSSEEPRRKRSRKKEPQPESSPAPVGAKSGIVEDELFRLTPTASAEFLEFLVDNEPTLQELAQDEKRHYDETIDKVYALLFKGAHQSELEKLDLATRPLPWRCDREELTLVCDAPPNRGTVQLEEGGWFWKACVERPHRFKHENPMLFDLDKALGWVEQELSKPPEEHAPEEEHFEITPAQLERLRPYWIDPSALEPESVTYRVVIDLDSQAAHFKTRKMSFDEDFYYDKEYLPPTMLARELHLDANRLEIEQLLGSQAGWYRITSLVTYLNEALAISQAQALWDQSRIAEQYKAGKILRAWYGVQEVETGYRSLLGMCDRPDSQWSKPQKRAEYMEHEALKETITQAGDLATFRAFLKLSLKDVNDERLLKWLHEWRAKSKHTPPETRVESEQWLRQHS